jgi:hypothetical protein
MATTVAAHDAVARNVYRQDEVLRVAEFEQRTRAQLRFATRVVIAMILPRISRVVAPSSPRHRAELHRSLQPRAGASRRPWTERRPVVQLRRLAASHRSRRRRKYLDRLKPEGPRRSSAGRRRKPRHLRARIRYVPRSRSCACGRCWRSEAGRTKCKGPGYTPSPAGARAESDALIVGVADLGLAF